MGNAFGSNRNREPLVFGDEPEVQHFYPQKRQQRKRLSERDYYRLECNALASCAGGKIAFDNNDEILNSYKNDFKAIEEQSRIIKESFDKILQEYDNGISIFENIKDFQAQIDKLHYCYVEFFRDSTFRIDPYVHERKLIARKAYNGLEELKASVNAIEERMKENIADAQEKTSFQINQANELLTHYNLTFKGPVAEPKIERAPITYDSLAATMEAEHKKKSKGLHRLAHTMFKSGQGKPKESSESAGIVDDASEASLPSAAEKARKWQKPTLQEKIDFWADPDPGTAV